MEEEVSSRLGVESSVAVAVSKSTRSSSCVSMEEELSSRLGVESSVAVG